MTTCPNIIIKEDNKMTDIEIVLTIIGVPFIIWMIVNDAIDSMQ